MPPSNLLSSVFGRSPIGPIQTHITKVYECASALPPFLDAVIAEDWDTAGKIQLNIAALEKEADDIKRKIRLSLPNSLFLAVPRTDFLELVTVQDKVANKAKDIAGLILGRKMNFPTELHDPIKIYIKRSVETAEKALQAVNELDELLEIGFRGREVKVVSKMIEGINQLESEVDKLQIKIRKLLFDLEKSLPPVDVMFMYKIIEWIGDLSDRASRVGSYLQLLLAK